MRLIDADALMEEIVDKIPANSARYSFQKFVQFAPTVDAVPVVHGEWIGDTCSVCNKKWDEYMIGNADDWGYFDPMPDFCQNCGADMRKEEK